MIDYSRFFILVDRKTGYRKPARIVRSELLIEFLATVSADQEISREERLFVCLLAGSGARISEMLKVKKQACKPKHFTLRVLKKDRVQHRLEAERKKAGLPPKPWNPVTRLAKVPEVSLELFQEHLTHRRPHENLFRYTRFQALRILKRLFGADVECHSFRHGWISYLTSLKKTGLEISELVKIDPKTAAGYAHITDMEAALDSLGV